MITCVFFELDVSDKSLKYTFGQFILEWFINNYSEILMYLLSNEIYYTGYRNYNEVIYDDIEVDYDYLACCCYLGLSIYNDGTEFERAIDLEESLFKIRRAIKSGDTSDITEHDLENIKSHEEEASYVTKETGDDICGFLGIPYMSDIEVVGDIAEDISKVAPNKNLAERYEKIEVSEVEDSNKDVWSLSAKQVVYMRKGLSSLARELINLGYKDSTVTIHEKDSLLKLSVNDSDILSLSGNNGYAVDDLDKATLAKAYLKSLEKILGGLPFSVKRISFNCRGITGGVLRDSEEAGSLEIRLF